MKVWGSLRDISQYRDLENVAVGLEARLLEASLVDVMRSRRRPVGRAYTKSRKSSAADIGSIVTVDASDLDERHEPSLLFC